MFHLCEGCSPDVCLDGDDPDAHAGFLCLPPSPGDARSGSAILPGEAGRPGTWLGMETCSDPLL